MLIIDLTFRSTRPLEKLRINNEEATTNIDRVRKWRLALTKVARLSGWHLIRGGVISSIALYV